MVVGVNLSQNSFIDKIKLHWKKILIISLILLLLIFLLYPRAYSYNLNDTCNLQSGVFNGRCIGIRVALIDYQEQTINGSTCYIDKQGQRCLGLSFFVELD